jgi:hypothetical protein
MRPRWTIQHATKAAANLIFGWSRPCIPLNEAPIGGTCTKHSFLLQPCDALLRAWQIWPIPTNSGFASHRAALFSCFVAAQRSPTFIRNPNVTSHTPPHPLTPRKKWKPPERPPPFFFFFGKFNQPDRGLAPSRLFCAAFSSPSATTLLSPKSADRASLG